MAADAIRQKRYCAKEQHLAVAHLALAQLRLNVACEIPGARGNIRGLGALLTELADVLAAALRANQNSREAGGNRGPRMAADSRGRHDVKQIESQPERPNLLRVVRVTEDQQCESTSRASGKGKHDKISTKNAGQLRTPEIQSGWKPLGKSEYCRQNSDGNRDHDNFRKKRSRGGCEDSREEQGSSRYRARGDRPRRRKKKPR